MRKWFLLIGLAFFNLLTQAQENKITSKITLKTGEIFTGEVVLRTDEILMLKNNAGARFQFTLSEIATIEAIADTKKSTITTTVAEPNPDDKFCGQLEISTSDASARKAFESATKLQANLIFGNRKVFGKDSFVGFGTGYLWINDVNLKLIPAIFKIQAYISKSRTSPYLGLESGYAFSATKSFGGGLFAGISAGANYKITQKSAFFIGLTATVYSISGHLSETIQQGIYTFDGTTAIQTLGIKAGLQF